MRYDTDKNRRRSIRLSRYDYRRAGAYFITVCAKDRESIFGEIKEGDMELNALGRAVMDEWLRIATLRSGVELDAFVVMPNHIHGIVFLNDKEGTARRAPTKEYFGRPVSGSLPTIVRAFKSAATIRINKLRGTAGVPVWQRNYYEHVIRNQEELDRIRTYIEANPAMWHMDEENPLAKK
jgi:REP-associated tyrosine transposase